MNEKMFARLRMLIAIGISLVIALVIITLVSETPLKTIGWFIFGPLKNVRYMGYVVELAIPLVFAGLATSILFRAELFNLGAEGIFYISGLTAAFVAVLVPVQNAFLHVLLALSAATAVGMLFGVVPGLLKAKWDANELVSSLMMNSILAGTGLYLLNNFLRDENLTEIASHKLAETAILPRLFAVTRIHAGIFICVAVLLVVVLFFSRHRMGYLLHMFGLNRNFTEYAGVSTFRMIVMTHLFAGAIAGLGGGVEILGMYDRFRWASLPGLGFDGALIALLAMNRPAAVPLAALFIAYIRTGSDIMARQSDVSSEMVFITQAIIILLVSAERFLHAMEQRQLLKKAGV